VELENKMAVLLGGRAAEQVIFNEVSTGASDDLVRATDMARAMVLRYGMSDALGNVAYDRERSAFLQQGFPMPQSREYSEDTANKIDTAVRALVDQALERAISILRKNRALLDQTADELLKTETLNQPQITALKQAIVQEVSS
jgi:cell division protease FtsH